MPRVWLTIGLAVTCAVACARAEDPPGLKETLALQETVQNAIQEAEPAIACILVSRNTEYRRYDTRPQEIRAFLDMPSPEEESGLLGEFDVKKTAQQLFGQDKRNEKELQQLDLANPRNVPDSYGSGVVIDEAGLILTTEHVIRGAVKVFVRLPSGVGRYANIIAADPRSDLAILGLINPPKKLKAIKFGDGGAVRKGQWIISLANPFAAGYRDGSPSASWGIVSNLRRRAPGAPSEIERSKVVHHYGTLIQADARLNLGCSGGALLDLHGDLIGLTTSLAGLSNTETAGGFAIPVDARFKRLVEVLKRGEEVEYGFLGVMFDPAGAGGEGNGVRLNEVLPNSPADQAGLVRGNRITKINGQAVHDVDDLLLAISMVPAGKEAVKIERVIDETGQALPTVKVVLTKAPLPGKVIASRRPEPVRGLRVDYTSTIAGTLSSDRLGPRSLPNGVVIRDVTVGSVAARDLRPGDIITHVNGVAVRTPAEFYTEATKDANKPIEIRLEAVDKPIKLPPNTP
jgi:S1-C subfamily serine protease